MKTNKIRNHEIILECRCEKIQKKMMDIEERITQYELRIKKRFCELNEFVSIHIRDNNEKCAERIKKLSEQNQDTIASRIYEWFEKKGWIKRPE